MPVRTYKVADRRTVFYNKANDKKGAAPMFGHSQKESLNYKPDWTSSTAHEKAGYIMDYYKIPIAGVCIALIIAGSFIHNIVTRPNPILHVTCVNCLLGDNEIAMLTDGYTSGPAYGRRDKVLLENGLFLAADPSEKFDTNSMVTQMKLMAMAAAGDLDVLLLDKSALNVLNGSEDLMDLDSLAVSDTLDAEEKELLSQLSSRFVSASGTGPHNGIHLAGTNLAPEDDPADTFYFALAANTAHLDEALSWLRCLMELPE